MALRKLYGDQTCINATEPLPQQILVDIGIDDVRARYKQHLYTLYREHFTDIGQALFYSPSLKRYFYDTDDFLFYLTTAYTLADENSLIEVMTAKGNVLMLTKYDIGILLEEIRERRANLMRALATAFSLIDKASSLKDIYEVTLEVL